MQRRTFRISNSQPIDEGIIYSKGKDNVQIDVRDIEASLQNLAKRPHCPLKEAPREFDEFVNMVNVLYGTEFYPALHELIVKHFGSFQPEKGTVSSYMVGCIKDSNPCSSLCAGSAPSGPGFTPCSDVVILVVWEGQYNFTVTNNSNSSRALLYLPHESSDQFPGFNAAEVQNLSNLNIQQAKLMNNSGQALGDFQDLATLPARPVNYTPPSVSPAISGPPPRESQITQAQAIAPQITSYPIKQSCWQKQNTSLWWIILAILVGLLLLYLAYRYMMKK